jgi:hypothetical protein
MYLPHAIPALRKRLLTLQGAGVAQMRQKILLPD